MIGIINYGMGNLASVKNSLDYLNISSKIIDNPADLKKVDKILLPGVGAYGMAMENLNQKGFTDTIQELVIDKQKPILGICLGMQLLLGSSTEHGLHQGLKIVQGKVLFLGKAIKKLVIPHVGWNEVKYNLESILFRNLPADPTFYFVHSYYCELLNPGNVVGFTDYGIPFHSAFEQEHIFGCQFHPEKSQKNGLSIFKNFDSI